MFYANWNLSHWRLCCSLLTNYKFNLQKNTVSHDWCVNSYLMHSLSDVFVINKVNSNGTSTVSCGTPLITGLSLLFLYFSRFALYMIWNSPTIHLSDHWCQSFLFYIIVLHGVLYQALQYSRGRPYPRKLLSPLSCSIIVQKVICFVIILSKFFVIAKVSHIAR